MSKQHHFVVFRDSGTKKWEIAEGGLLSGDDEPIFDTKTEEWIGIHSETDSNEDSEALEDLRRRLSVV